MLVGHNVYLNCGVKCFMLAGEHWNAFQSNGQW